MCLEASLAGSLGILSRMLPKHPQTFHCLLCPRPAGRCFARVGERPVTACPSSALVGTVLSRPGPWGLPPAWAPGTPYLWALPHFVGRSLRDSASGFPWNSELVLRWLLHREVRNPCSPPFHRCSPFLRRSDAHLPTFAPLSKSPLSPVCPLTGQLTPGCLGHISIQPGLFCDQDPVCAVGHQGTCLQSDPPLPSQAQRWSLEWGPASHLAAGPWGNREQAGCRGPVREEPVYLPPWGGRSVTTP